MRFPVTIVFCSLGWGVNIAVEDGTGARIGFAPYRVGRDGRLWIYADEDLAQPIYVAQAEAPFGCYALRNAGGALLGRLARGEAGGGYVISVVDEPRFEVAALSPALHFVDWLIDPVPVFNVLTGLLMRPCHVYRRRGSEAGIGTMTKRRTMFDAAYRLDLDGDVDGPEGECLALASIVVAMHSRRYASSW